MGSVCGGPPGLSVGVAPGAQWIHAAVIDRVSIQQTVSDSILAFQWLIDPDGDPGTHFDVPDVCSNSWGVTTGHGFPNSDETFWVFLDACEAAGIVIVFSAGNEGFSGLRRPSDRATDDFRTMAVAAVDGNNPSYPIAGFSSRGPTFCTPGGQAAIKPDISAPGVDVRSSVPGNGYSFFSGTSMASPHINGVIALMRQANPNLAVQDIKQIIFDTAFDLGQPGEDNNYGWGMVDALEAVQIALSTASLTFTYPDGRPDLVDPEGGTTIRVLISGEFNPPVDGTGKLHYSTGGDFVEVSMEQEAPNDYTAVLPAFECGTQVSYYFSAQAENGDLSNDPASAPKTTYVGQASSGFLTLFVDDFESDQGWTVTDSEDLTTGSWERGVPLGGGDRGDPEIDADGSGQCFVTGLLDGDNDVDGGTTVLTSPVLDASDPQTYLSYHRWYANHIGDHVWDDVFVVEVSDDGGLNWTVLESIGPDGPEVVGDWFPREYLIAEIPGISNTDQFRVRFVASDLNVASIVEAGIDAFEVGNFFCKAAACPADLDGDGGVGAADLAELLGAWGPCEACPADFNGDGFVGAPDLAELLGAWGPCL
jgi:bacillopeptidase F